ncbi:hypothetical protein GCM10009742_07210 [Kribbella karoonensis]|uniref:Uncharacterized protein n=1 Tax=Kribbella karoonensis TaxID=324851 RepID=A0ABN2D2M5_9ACTN
MSTVCRRAGFRSPRSRTTIGLLVAPRPETDVVAPDDWFLEVAWSGGWETYRPAGGLSLHSADRAHVLDELDRAGWKLLENSEGLIEPAGRTADGRQAPGTST